MSFWVIIQLLDKITGSLQGIYVQPALTKVVGDSLQSKVDVYSMCLITTTSCAGDRANALQLYILRSTNTGSSLSCSLSYIFLIESNRTSLSLSLDPSSSYARHYFYIMRGEGTPQLRQRSYYSILAHTQERERPAIAQPRAHNDDDDLFLLVQGLHRKTDNREFFNMQTAARASILL